MHKKNLIQGIVLGLCITMFTSSAVLASASTPQLKMNQIQARTIENKTLQKQREIDQLIFEQYKGDFTQQGFKVTHTSPQKNYVEVGITPYTEENATFLYNLLGKDMVKVVEGQQAVLMTATASTSGIATTSVAPDKMAVNEDIIQKQKEIDQLIFEQYKGNFTQQGFKVTHTSPQENFVAVGITPYTEENAAFLYNLLGRDMVKVVEGQQAVLLNSDGSTNMEAMAATDTLKMEDEETSNSSIYAIILGILAIVGGFIVYRRKPERR